MVSGEDGVQRLEPNLFRVPVVSTEKHGCSRGAAVCAEKERNSISSAVAASGLNPPWLHVNRNRRYRPRCGSHARSTDFRRSSEGAICDDKGVVGGPLMQRGAHDTPPKDE
jgi:hypothetical protein